MQSSNNPIGSNFTSIAVYSFILPCIAVIALYDGLCFLFKKIVSFLLKVCMPFFRFVILRLNSKLDAVTKSGFLYENEVKEYAIKLGAEQAACPMRKLQDCQQNRVTIALRGSISDLALQAGFQPYNLCLKKIGESDAVYAQRVGRYRLEQLAEQLVKNDVIIDFLCSNTKRKLSDTLLEAAEAYKNSADMVSLTEGLCFNGKVLTKFMDKVFDKERLNSLILAIDRLQYVANKVKSKESSAEDLKHMQDAVINILDLAFTNIETLVPDGISCLSGISDIVLQQIRYRNADNSTVQLRRGKWDLLLGQLNLICQDIVSSIKSFRSSADGGRIYGEWFIGLVKVIDSIEVFLQNFTDYIHPSSFIASNEGLLSSGLIAEQAKEAFATLDSILPEVDGKKIALDQDGGIKRLIELILKTITSELPLVLEYLRSVLQERYENYIAENGIIEKSNFDMLSIKDVRDIIALAKQRKSRVVQALEGMISGARGCLEAFDSLDEYWHSGIRGMFHNINNTKVKTALQVIEGAVKVLAKKIQLDYGQDFHEVSTAIRYNICSLTSEIKELEELKKAALQLYDAVEGCGESEKTCFLPTLQDQLCTLREKIERVVESKIVPSSTEFMKKFINTLSLSKIEFYSSMIEEQYAQFADAISVITERKSVPGIINNPVLQAIGTQISVAKAG